MVPLEDEWDTNEIETLGRQVPDHCHAFVLRYGVISFINVEPSGSIFNRATNHFGGYLDQGTAIFVVTRVRIDGVRQFLLSEC